MALSDLDRAVDVLVEMKNLSEVAVGLAYSALVLRDPLLAAEVKHLEDRLDEMKDRLELWVLRAARQDLDPGALRGLLHLSQAAEDLGDQAQQMVWLVEDPGDEVHPILAIAFGETDEVAFQVPVSPGSVADGASLSSLAIDVEPGFQVLAIRRADGYLYRPRGPRCCSPVTRCWPRAPTRVVRRWRACLDGASMWMRTPARGSCSMPLATWFAADRRSGDVHVMDNDGDGDIDVTGRAVWMGAEAANSLTAAIYQGPDGVIEVSVTGDRKGEVIAHHIVLARGSVPAFVAGAPPSPPMASLELSRKDARAQQEGRLAPVVGYMRGTTKTKGGTRPLYEFFRSVDRR